jgi:hypothetical protein
MAADPSFYDDIIAQISSGAKEFRGGADELRKIAAQQEFQKQAPDLISEMSGQGIGLYSPSEARGQLALLASNSGDPSILRELVKSQIEPKKQAQPLMTASQINANGGYTPAQKKELIAAQTAEQQNDLARQYASGNASVREGEAENRRIKETVQKQRNALSSELSKISKNIRESDELFSNVKDSLAKGTLPADAVVFNFLARKLAGEKGPLAVQDREQFVNRAFGGDLQKAANFFSGESTTVLSPEQRQAFKDLVNQSVKNYERVKASSIEDTLTQAIGGKPDLFTDKADRLATDFAKKYGYEFKNQDGSWDLRKKEIIKSQGTEADLKSKEQTAADPFKSQMFLDLPEELKARVVNLGSGKTVDQIKRIIENTSKIPRTVTPNGQ